MKNDFAIRDVVPCAVVAEPDAPLPFSGCDAGKFLDLVPSHNIVWIGAECNENLFDHSGEFLFIAHSLSCLTVECRSRENVELAGHAE